MNQRLKVFSNPQRLKIAIVCLVLTGLLCLLIFGCLGLVRQKNVALDIRSLVSSHQVSLCHGQYTALSF